MKQIAILGASSRIAKDLVRSMVANEHVHFHLYVRDVEAARSWTLGSQLEGRCTTHHYEQYGEHPHEAVINFVGVGDPKRATRMGAQILTLSQQFDDMVLAGLERNPGRRYLFLSSGAAYGSVFLEPAGPLTPATISINAMLPQEYYSVAKLYAECKHRARADFSIVDIRVFNYFSRSQDLDARFFITDILRAIRDGEILNVSSDPMVRDYLHPSDFHQLVDCILQASPQNNVFDCYTRAPIDKATLLAAMQKHFGLRYKVTDSGATVVNATGAKPNYYSLNRGAASLGYRPAFTSLEGIIAECAFVFEQRLGAAVKPEK